LKADSQLRDLIRDRRLWHRGEPDLIEHLQNANAEIDAQESKMRLVKRTDSLKIDLAVCLSMDCYELLRLNL
jgi:phage terminase large subunit-like protein